MLKAEQKLGKSETEASLLALIGIYNFVRVFRGGITRIKKKHFEISYRECTC